MQSRFRVALIAALTVSTLSASVSAYSASGVVRTGPVPVAQPESRAHDFWRTMNMNTHFSFGKSSYDARAVRQMVNLGFAGVRDKLWVNSAGRASHEEQLDAFGQFQAAGMKVHSTVGDLGDSQARVNAIVGAVRSLGGARMFRSLGGVNEPDGGNPPGWAEKTVTHQRYLWEATADLRADGVEIVGPSLMDQGTSPEADFAKLASLGIGRYVTHGDFHLYPRGKQPTTGLQERLTWSEQAYDKPSYATETGYNTGLHITGRGNAITEDVQATYTPRLFAEFFKAGVDATFLYALMDDMSRDDTWERYWGQVRADGTPKPSYRALSYLAHLVKGASPTPDSAPMQAAFTAGDASVKHLNLDFGGKYLLLLWRDVLADDTRSTQFNITFEHAVRVKVHRPAIQNVRERGDQASHPVSVGKNLVVVEVPSSELRTVRR